MDNKEWSKALRKGYLKETNTKRSVRLPSEDDIQFGGSRNRLTVRLTQNAVVANMQTNKSAFEAWSLALVAFCEVKSVEICWEAPEDLSNPHYARFLYRISRFCSMFPWVSIASPNTRALETAKVLVGREFICKVPSFRAS